MFKEKFSQEMQNILPSENVKANILKRIKTEQEKSVILPVRSLKKRWIPLVATALVVVIVCATVFDLPIFNNEKYISDESDPKITKTSSVENPADESSSLQSIPPEKQNEKPLNNAPKSTTYDAVYKLYEEIDAIQTAQNEHSFYVNTESVALGGSNKGPYSNSGNSASSAPVKQYTETNLQVEGVEEGDIVKTDGKYIYTFGRSDDEINITKAIGGKLGKMACIKIEETPNYELYDDDSYPDVKDLYIYGNTLVAIVSARRKSKSYKGICTVAMLFDVSNPKTPKCIKQYVQTGNYESTRIIGDKLYVFSSDYTYRIENVKGEDDFYEEKKVWHLPQFGTDNKVLKFIEEENLYIFDGM